MTVNGWMYVVFLMLALLLPLAALRDRKLRPGRLAVMAGIWAVIFLAGAVLFMVFGG